MEIIRLSDFQKEILYVLEDMRGRVVNEQTIRLLMNYERSIQRSLDILEKNGLIKSKLVKAIDSDKKEKIYALTKLSIALLEEI